MGVQGLTHYIKRSTSLAHTTTIDSASIDRTAEKVSLVIDGLAFCHHTGTGHAALLGGNYAEYRRIVRQHVEYWRFLNLEPLFVWDGTFSVSKQETILKRSQTYIESCGAYMKASDALRASDRYVKMASMLPLMTRSACVAELRTLDVEMHFAPEEADVPVAMLASRLKGYIVSNDSDFLIINSDSRGYIPLDSLVYGPDRTSLHLASQEMHEPSITFDHYQSSDLANNLDLPLNFLPLLAAFVGNDLYNYGSEISVDGQTCRQPSPPQAAKALRLHDNMPATSEDEIRAIVSLVAFRLFIHAGREDFSSILSNLTSSAMSYLPPSSTTSTSSTNFCLLPTILDTPTQAQCRNLYHKAFESGKLGRQIAQIIQHNFLSLSPVLEDPSYQSTHTSLGRPLRDWLYSILHDGVGIRDWEVVEAGRRQDQAVLWTIPVVELSSIQAVYQVEVEEPGATPILLQSFEERLRILIGACSGQTLLDSGILASNPSILRTYLPLILSLRHIQSRLTPARRWSQTELYSAIVTSFLLHRHSSNYHNFLPASTVPLSKGGKALAPSKVLIQRSTELVNTMFHLSQLMEVLLLDEDEGGISQPHTLFNGTILHRMMGLGKKITEWIKGLDRESREEIEELFRVVVL